MESQAQESQFIAHFSQSMAVPQARLNIIVLGYVSHPLDVRVLILPLQPLDLSFFVCSRQHNHIHSGL